MGNTKMADHLAPTIFVSPAEILSKSAQPEFQKTLKEEDVDSL